MRHFGSVCAALALATPLACGVDYEANQAKYDRARCALSPYTCTSAGGTTSSGGAAGSNGVGGMAGSAAGQGGGSSGGASGGGNGGSSGGSAGQAGVGGTSQDCSDGDVRCLDGNAETCSANQWLTTVCEAPTPACEAGACVVCANDSQRCNTGGPELCVSNTWQPQAACGANEICQTGQCMTPPSCASLASDCGASSNDNCCASLPVTG
ncbi:MAG TPA: hypothetical protein VGP93_17195, partial [Polyangiaceae bacterium]|nr:hypothetical protein [Polyangiaceae bacterium]